MKILVVSQYFWPESFKINDLTSELVKRGHEVTVFTGLPNYPKGEFFDGYSFWKGPFKEKFEGVEIIRIPIVPRGRGRGIQLMINFLYFGLFGSLLAPLLLRNKYDRIFIYGLSPIFLAIPGIVLKKLWKVPTTFWVTDLWPESLIATGVVKKEILLKPIRWIVKWIYRNTDLILTSSEGFIHRVEDYQIPSSRIKFWPQWAESLFEKDMNTDYSDEQLPKDYFTILFAGNIGEAQDMPNLIDTAKILKDYENIKFIILGEGIKKDWVTKEIHRLKLSNIILLGRKPIDTMPYYFKHSSVLFVSLVKSDIFSITIPSKIQTYMASAKPILAALDGEGGDLITKWNAGLSVPASSPELLAKAILNLNSKNKEELDLLGKNAYHCYKQLFDREQLISNLEKDLINL